MQKTLLVTGGAGFIGSNFVEFAAEQKYRIVVLDAFTYAGHVENLDALPASLRGSWELVRGDVGDSVLVSQLLRKHRPAAVLNFAAESHVDKSIAGPQAFVHTNIVGAFNLLSCSLEYWSSLGLDEKAGFRFLQVSTDEVYGSLGSEGLFSETTAMAPNSPYSASKASADMLARAWHHTYGLPVLVTNCSNNYGPRQFPEKLIPFMIHCAESGRPLPLYGDGKNVRDWIHVRDHCAGVLLALEKGRPGETYCLGGRTERSNLDVVLQICALLDELRPKASRASYAEGIAFVDDRLGHDRRYAIDDSKAERELGFKRRYNFNEGLAMTVKWYLENGAWTKAVLRSAHERLK